VRDGLAAAARIALSEKHRSPTPKHAATAGISPHACEGISYPSLDHLSGGGRVFLGIGVGWLAQ
jgi:hypothetical protein